MAASSIFIALSLILLVGSISAAPVDDDANEGALCVTGKGIPGNCMIRNDCEYSTLAIDLTIYKPKGYKSTCTEKQVCCPDKYQVKMTAQPPQEEEEDDFSFDDDD